MKIAIASLLFGFVSMFAQARAQSIGQDNCGCSAVLAKDTKAQTLFEQTGQRLQRWHSLDNETLYQRIQDKSFDAEVGWGAFGGSAGASSRDQVIQKARQRISQRVDEETQRAVQSSINESATTKEAIQAWRNCIVECIGVSRPFPGLAVALLDPVFGDVVRMRVSFTSPAGYAGALPRIDAVNCFGLRNANSVKDGLTGKTLGTFELALQRENPAQTTATVTVWTDIWGSVSIVLPMTPDGSGERRWAEQIRFAFERGVPLVASGGCFEDGIIIRWADITDPDFHAADVIEIMASLEPDPYAHRHWWMGVIAHASNEYKLTANTWKAGLHEDVRKRLGIESLPVNTPIYFQIGIAWGPNDKRNFRLVGARYVAGWVAEAGSQTALPLQFTGPVVLDQEGAHLKIRGPAGSKAEIQRSKALPIWEDWLSITLQDSPIAITDREVGSSEKTFFRIMIK